MATSAAVPKSPTSARVALVTGANQGIGLEIVRQLCRLFDGTVILCARNVDRGQSAVKNLMEEGLSPVFLPLDVDSSESVEAAREALATSYGRLDILINNAGIMLNSSELSLAEKASRTITTNYHGVINVTNAFWPLLQPNSRVVNVSSGLGRIIHVGKERQDEILSPDMTVEKLSSIMDRYVEDCKLPEAEFKSKGWTPEPDKISDINAYCVSKIGLNRITELWAERASKDPTIAGTLVNCMSPGWVKTELGSQNADLSVEEGADSVLYLALLPPDQKDIHGVYVYQRKVRSWKEAFKADS